MKKAVFALLLCVLASLTACEKHDGTDYFKAKCVAELNGTTYIDQTPFSLSPDVIVTPSLRCSDRALTFTSMLRTEHKGPVAYTVSVYIFTDEPDQFLTEEQTIEKIDFEATDSSLYESEYARHCRDNKISYATVNDEIVKSGTFAITSHDTAARRYSGSFTLRLAEGTLTGRFDL